MHHETIDIQKPLIELCQKGDRVAQYRLYKLYSKSMYNICTRMLSDKSEAQDLLQESFVKIFRQLGTFKGDSSLGVWIRKIVIHDCLNFLKKKKPILIAFGDEEENTFIDEPLEESVLTADLIGKAIAELPSGAAIVFQLYALEDYKHKEIAKMLNISESTSKSQYQRARSLLQETIKRKLYEDRA